MKFPTYTPYKRLEFRTISDMHQKLELCISSGACGVVQSRMGILTGLYHVPQVFHVASSQLSYSHMLDENNGSHLMVVKHHQNRHKIHRRCTFVHSSHNWEYFLKPTFIYVHIGQDGIVVLNLALSFHTLW